VVTFLTPQALNSKEKSKNIKYFRITLGIARPRFHGLDSY